MDKHSLRTFRFLEFCSGPLGICVGLYCVLQPLPGPSAASNAWVDPLLRLTGAALVLWGTWWLLCCLLAAAARHHHGKRGRLPNWYRLLPRRSLMVVGLASASLVTVVPTHAAQHEPVTTVAALATEEADGLPSPAWPISNPAVEATPEPVTETTPELTAKPVPDPATASPQPQRSWQPPPVAHDLPTSLGGRTREETVVDTGDTLWSIAARHLGPSATTADIAEEWPRWYRANIDVIGNDPNAIHPGTRLFAPR